MTLQEIYEASGSAGYSPEQFKKDILTYIDSVPENILDSSGDILCGKNLQTWRADLKEKIENEK